VENEEQKEEKKMKKKTVVMFWMAKAENVQLVNFTIVSAENLSKLTK
jgi:hypothetical protein